MTSTEWIAAIGQTLFVMVTAFVLLCVATSWVRYQMMSESAREAEELGHGPDRALRQQVLGQIAISRRQRQPFSLLLLRVAAGQEADAALLLRKLLRAGDTVMACGERLVGIVAQCGSEKTPALTARLVAEGASAGATGTEAWRFGVSGYPEHGFKTSELHGRAVEMLAQAEQQNQRVAGMADAEAVAETSTAKPGQVDELTGLVHEQKMIDVMRRYIALLRRADRPATMVYLMIDQLDRLSEVHSAPVLNAMIKELAGKLSRSTRESDMLARFGTGGFVLAMPVTPAEAVAVAQRLIQDVRKQAFTAGNGMKVSVSAGVAGYPDVIGTAVQYFVAAEAALNQARLRGRSQCLTYDRSMVLRNDTGVTEQHL